MQHADPATVHDTLPSTIRYDNPVTPNTLNVPTHHSNEWRERERAFTTVDIEAISSIVAVGLTTLNALD